MINVATKEPFGLSLDVPNPYIWVATEQQAIVKGILNREGIPCSIQEGVLDGNNGNIPVEWSFSFPSMEDGQNAVNALSVEPELDEDQFLPLPHERPS